MWDWIKKAAGTVLETGAEYLRHLGAIQQIMNAPSYEAAIDRLRQHIFAMTSEAEFNLFMSVVAQQTRQAEQALEQASRNPSGESWGGSFEDQMAQRMAESRAGYHAGNSPHVQAAEKRLHDLGLLVQYARQFWQQRRPQLDTTEPPATAAEPEAPAQREPEPQAPREPTPAERIEAFQRHARSILGDPPVPAAGADTGTKPLGEVEALQAMLDADRRLTHGMMSTMPGMATVAGVEELTALHGTYARLLRDAPRDSSLIEPADLRRKMGQCMEFAGRACESLRDDAEAVNRYRDARAEFEQAGDADEAGRMARKVRELEILLEGDHDAEIMDLQDRLDTVERPSLEAAELLIALGAASTRAGDAFAAREHLHQAETTLHALGITPPVPDQLANDLFGSLNSLMAGSGGSPTPIETSMKVRAVYKQLYQALSAAYRDADPDDPDYEDNLDRADQYLRAWEEMDGSAQNQAFSAQALAHLQGRGKKPAED